MFLHSTSGHGKGSRTFIFGSTMALRFPNVPWEQQALGREGGGGEPCSTLQPSLPSFPAPPTFLKPQAVKEVVRTVSMLLLRPHQDSLSRQENGTDTLSSTASLWERDRGLLGRPAIGLAL